MQMDDNQVRLAVSLYRRWLKSRGIVARQIDLSKPKVCRAVVLSHCAWMLDRIHDLLATGRTDQARRWMGFVQGCLFALGCLAFGEIPSAGRPSGRSSRTGG